MLKKVKNPESSIYELVSHVHVFFIDKSAVQGISPTKLTNHSSAPVFCWIPSAIMIT